MSVQGIDVEAIVDFAYRHEVVHWVLDCLVEISDIVPEQLICAMKVYVNNIETKNKQFEEVSRIVAIGLRDNKCEVMFAKGVVFNKLINGGDQRRLTKDIDIYTRRADVDLAYCTIYDLGFNREFCSLKESLRNLHHHSMYSEKFDAMVELHWAIAPAWNNSRADMDALLSSTLTTEINGVPLRVPDHEDWLLFICLELEKDSWNSLKRLMDLSALISMHARHDLDRAIATVHRAGKLRALAVSLHVASDLGLVSLPDKLASVARSDITANRIAVLVGERILRGPLPFWKRLYKEIVLAQKHDRLAAQLLHLWRVSVLWRLSKAVRVASRRATRRSQSGPIPKSLSEKALREVEQPPSA